MALVSRNKLAGEILFVGVGMGGCKFANALQMFGYEAYYINTSTGDLKLLSNVTDEMKYPIPNSNGCDKDMEKGFKHVGAYISDIYNKIDTNYSMYKTIVVCTTFGGGTGAGSAMALAQYLAGKYYGIKDVCLIAGLPSKDDGIISVENALKCIKKLEEECQGLKTKILLDNSMMDKFDINKEFATDFDIFLSLPEIELDSLELSIDEMESFQKKMKFADETETRNLLSNEGYMYISRIKSPTNKTDKGEPYCISDSEYMPKPDLSDGCTAMAVSLSRGNIHDFNPTHLFNYFGHIIGDVKAGINETNTSYAYIFGASISQRVIDNLEAMKGELIEQRNKKKSSGLVYSENPFESNVRRTQESKAIVNPFASLSNKPEAPKRPQNPFAGSDALPDTNPFRRKR